MYHIKDDKRSISSASLIYSALEKLIKVESYDAITISKLTEKAGVGRATFYRLFDSLDDVLIWQMDLVIEGLTQYIISEVERESNKTTFHILKCFFGYWFSHSSVIEILIKINRLDIFRNALACRLNKINSLFELRANIEPELRDYFTAIRVNMAGCILEQWIKRDKKEHPDMLAKMLYPYMSLTFSTK